LIAFGLCIVLFAFWSILGYAVVRALKVRMDPLQEMLLAPAVGVVVLTIPLFLVNRLGVPVSRFTYPLTVVLLVVAGLSVLLTRPRLLWRDWRPFGFVLLLALVAAGWPMLEFGFDWLSLCNDDMANYCLGAARFYHYGFFDAPELQELLAARDYTQFYWYLHVPGMVRPGVELVLAWAMALTQLHAHQIFMPTVIAFHLCQISALGALVYQSPAMRRPALAGCALLAVSALATFGALYQLIAQVYGMALIAATAAVLLRPYGGPGVEPMWRRGLLGGILGAGLLLLYPEVIPIVGGSWLLYLFGEALHRRLPAKALGVFVAAALVVVVGLLWRQALGIVGFMYGQAAKGSTGADLGDVFFPFYQLPSGMADFWGFFPLTYVPTEPVGSIAIAAAALLLLFAVAAAARLAWRRHPVAIVAAVMLALAAYLLVRGANFGLYKIAMFLQPFVLGTMALAAFALFKRARTAVLVLVLLALPGLYVQQVYVVDSRGAATAGGFPEIADPTRSRINHDLQQTLAAHADAAHKGGIVSDTSNIVLAKFESYYTRGFRSVFPGATVGISVLGFTHEGKALAPQDVAQLAVGLHRQMNLRRHRYDFNLHDPAHPDATNWFEYSDIGPFADPEDVPGTTGLTPDTLLVITGPKQGILNRWGARRRFGTAADEMNFLVRPLDRVSDHLVFIESELGRSYFMSHYGVSMYQLEPDPIFYRGKTMAGVGRRFMFQALHPTPGSRLVLELTSSLNADGNNRLPDAIAIGSRQHSLGLTGRGSARVFSPPLEPQVLGGRSFVGLDLRQDAVPFREERNGLMRLYGRDVSLDRRMLVCFSRDISMVSQRHYASMVPPASIGKFPRDLENQALEYSGIYEDGWASDRAWCRLSQPWDADAVVVRGSVPHLTDLSFQTELTVLVDGREAARKTVGLQGFEIRAPLPKDLGPADGAGQARRRVELVFSKLQNLPRGDQRPVSCMITHLGFGSPPAPPVALQKFPDDFHANPLHAATGLSPDGWVAQRVSVQLAQPPAHHRLTVRGMVPQIADASFSSAVRVLVDGQTVAEQSVRVGEFEITVPVPDKSPPGARKVELEFSAAQNLPAADGRTVTARLSFLGFAPSPKPPSRLEQFPQDLRLPLVQAAGVYDDGWVGPAASFQLDEPLDAWCLEVSGMVPQIGDASGFKTEAVILLDGKEIDRRNLGVGQFDIRLPLTPQAAGESTRRIELKFSAVQTLPAPDDRNVAARLTAVRFATVGE
jgi:hypothetical protein